MVFSLFFREVNYPKPVLEVGGLGPAVAFIIENELSAFCWGSCLGEDYFIDYILVMNVKIVKVLSVYSGQG